MSVMSLDNTLWLAYILTEVAVVSLLIYRRVWRLLPLFCVYCVWDVLSNTEGFASAHLFHNGFSNYLITYLIQTAIDSGIAVLRIGRAGLVRCCALCAAPFLAIRFRQSAS